MVVEQISSFAAQGFREQEARSAGKREGGGMELEELHVGQFGAGLRGQGDAVAGGYGGIGGVGVDLACAAGGDEEGAGGDAMAVRAGGFGAGGGKVGSDDAAAGDDQVGDHGPLGKADALLGAGKGDEGTADLGAGGVAVGVEDAGQRVSAFAGAEQAASFRIKARAPLDEFGHAERAFGDERFGGGAVDEAVAGIDGVFEMEGDVLVAFHGDGDSALGVVGIGLAERLLGDDQDIAVAGQFDGGAQAGNACAHDQKINLLGRWHLL